MLELPLALPSSILPLDIADSSSGMLGSITILSAAHWLISSSKLVPPSSLSSVASPSTAAEASLSGASIMLAGASVLKRAPVRLLVDRQRGARIRKEEKKLASELKINAATHGPPTAHRALG